MKTIDKIVSRHIKENIDNLLMAVRCGQGNWSREVKEKTTAGVKMHVGSRLDGLGQVAAR